MNEALEKVVVPSDDFLVVPESLGELKKSKFACINGKIDMRWEDTEAGSKLVRKIREDQTRNGFVLMGKSGCGKTSSIFQVARSKWLLLFTATSGESREAERLGGANAEVGGDAGFAEMVEKMQECLLDDDSSNYEKTKNCNKIMKCAIAARLFVMQHFQGLGGADPCRWMQYQLTSEFQICVKAVADRLWNRQEKTVDSIYKKAWEGKPPELIAIDEIQFAYKLLKEHSVWKNSKGELRGIASPLIQLLDTAKVPLVLAGTALSLPSSHSCVSDLGKQGGNASLFTEFEDVSLDSVEECLNKWLNVDDTDFEKLPLYLLEGRGRLVAGVIPKLVNVVNNRSKQDSLGLAITSHYNNMKDGLVKRIGKALEVENTKDFHLLNKLGVAALMGGTIMLDPKKLDVDLIDIGICSLDKQVEKDTLYLPKT